MNQICLQQILQDCSKGAMKKYTKTTNKKSKKVKGKLDPNYSKTFEKELKKSTLLQNYTQNQLRNSLLSCPECPFSTLSAPTFIQHKYKHSLGKPFLCPHCHTRHPSEELHIAHQKRNHPRMKVVINKSINAEIIRSEESRISSLRISNFVSPSACPSVVQQTCKNFQVASPEPPLTNACSEDFYCSRVAAPKNQISVVKTESSQPLHGHSKSRFSTLSSDCPTQEDMLQSKTKTQKPGKRQRASISLGVENSKRPFVEHPSTPITVNVPVCKPKFTHQDTGVRRSLRTRKNWS